MAFIPAPQVASVNLNFDYRAQRCQMTLYFEQANPITPAAMTALAQRMETWFAGTPKALMSNDAALREIVVTDLTTETSGGVVRALNPPVAGTDGNGEPNSVTIAISFRTTQRGRSFRGRNYWVGLSSNQVSENEVTTTFEGAITAAYTELLQPGGLPAGWTWVVLSRYANGVPRLTAVATPVASVTLSDQTVDSQRRRLPGRGR